MSTRRHIALTRQHSASSTARGGLLVATLAALVGSGPLSGCRDETDPPVAPAALSVPSGAIRALVELHPGASAATRVLVVRIVGRVPDLAAYQGTVTFDPAQLAVVDVLTPSVLADGEVHLVNRAELAAGQLRFAAYAPEALGTDEALRLVVRAAGSEAGAATLAVTLQVGGTVTGTALAAPQLHASEGVHLPSGARVY
jgi:hypothetical protein